MGNLVNGSIGFGEITGRGYSSTQHAYVPQTAVFGQPNSTPMHAQQYQ